MSTNKSLTARQQTGAANQKRRENEDNLQKFIRCICNVTYNSNTNSLNLISLLLNNSHLVKENATEKLQFSGVSKWLNYLNLNDLWEIELSTLYMNDLNKIYNQSFSSSAIIEIL
ncbi:hypothetical protein BpHYR1_020483 [Brachionus plicatilis]|uniref:Uncharacterized protein n=1 Tax=Brachionus plicatilis TaxID=10195 RepID=A0A3M7S7G9_BRAPC|nr:hypothetical protein BpHYR1_020483 [Brachionus plicatilis]